MLPITSYFVHIQYYQYHSRKLTRSVRVIDSTYEKDLVSTELGGSNLFTPVGPIYADFAWRKCQDTIKMAKERRQAHPILEMGYLSV
jgi:hypothetical protein